MLLGLSVERSIQSTHHNYGSLLGKARKSPPAVAIFDIFEALGSIAFSFSFVSLANVCKYILEDLKIVMSWMLQEILKNVMFFSAVVSSANAAIPDITCSSLSKIPLLCFCRALFW